MVRVISKAYVSYWRVPLLAACRGCIHKCLDIFAHDIKISNKHLFVRGNINSTLNKWHISLYGLAVACQEAAVEGQLLPQMARTAKIS
jgi:hypothetical protein